MNASDVYTIAKALPHEEVVRLYDMIAKDVQKSVKIKKKRKKQLEYSFEDAVRFLLNNHMKK